MTRVTRGMRAELILFLMLFSASPIMASHEAGVVGPYNVSFDMNTTMDYSVIVEKSSSGVTEDGVKFDRYNMSVQSTDYFAWIVLTRYTEPMLANITANAYIVQSALVGSGADEPNYYQPLIDGKPGVLGNFRFERQDLGNGQYKEGDLVVAASYSPDAKVQENGEYRGITNVRLLSTFPWEVTRDLLYYLHVEAPGDQAASQVLPVNQSQNQSANASQNQSLNQSQVQSLSQSLNQSQVQSLGQSLNQPQVQSLNQSQAEALNLSKNQTAAQMPELPSYLRL